MQGPGRGHRRNWGIFELAAGYRFLKDCHGTQKADRSVCVALGLSTEHREEDSGVVEREVNASS